MATICPAILAVNEKEYRTQVEKIAHFARRIQIDLTDGIFAEPKTVNPKQAWWPVGMLADFHLMYQRPEKALNNILEHQPHMIIVQAEADGNFEAFAKLCHKHKVKIGVALLQKTTPQEIFPALAYIDHVLIFGGNLGHYGGHADLSQLEKVKTLKNQKKDLEIGWDGGINDQNISQLAFADIDVFNVGGFIQKADNPESAFTSLQRIADETGTT